MRTSIYDLKRGVQELGHEETLYLRSTEALRGADEAGIMGTEISTAVACMWVASYLQPNRRPAYEQ